METPMAVQGIDHINLSASGRTFAALRDFYRDALGLEPGLRLPLRSTGLWLYAGAAPIVHLVELPGEDGVAAPRAARAGLDHVALRCADLVQSLEQLQRFGVAHVVNEVNAAGQILVRLEDPTGLTLELVFDSRKQP
jgi:catechol 2,3-dioxygenase-like lactoylglutathione lyase family enzyme